MLLDCEILLLAHIKPFVADLKLLQTKNTLQCLNTIEECLMRNREKRESEGGRKKCLDHIKILSTLCIVARRTVSHVCGSFMLALSR